MEGKSPSETAIHDHTYKIFPNDLNSQGTVFGGMIMGVLDRIALVIAERHSGKVCVTASVDALHFLAPAGTGNNLIFKGSINRSWNTSMEIGIRVEAEDYLTTKRTHIVSAYFTFVALDENRNKASVPPVLPLSADEKRRFEEAEMRRQSRFLHAEKQKESRRHSKR